MLDQAEFTNISILLAHVAAGCPSIFKPPAQSISATPHFLALLAWLSMLSTEKILSAKPQQS
jgi:hypothetical protein